MTRMASTPKTAISEVVSNPIRCFALLPHAYGQALLVATVSVMIITSILFAKGMPRRATDRAWQPQKQDGFLTLGNLLESKLKDYKASLSVLDANIKLQALFILIAILLLIRRSDTLLLFGNQVPLQWLHLFAPVLMIYLWLSFGFRFDDLIKSRICGVDLINAIGTADGKIAKSLLHDSGFIDGWTMMFVDTPEKDYSGIDHNFKAASSLFLVTVLGTLVAAAHASLLAIVITACRRYIPIGVRRRLLYLYGVPLVALAILILSHVQFAYGGFNRNWIQLYIAVCTLPLLFMLLMLSLRVDAVRDPTLAARVRRQRAHHIPCTASHNVTNSLGLAPGPARTEIGLIGDSLSTCFHVSAPLSMLWSCLRGWRQSWFNDDASRPRRIHAFCDRVAQHVTVMAYNYASVGARVDSRTRRTIWDWLIDRRDFSHQVSEVLCGSFPDVLLIWIGHNEMDWRQSAEHPSDTTLTGLANRFESSFRVQLERLIKGVKDTRKQVAIVVLGLINFESFFLARSACEARRNGTATWYPFLDRDYDYFPSMRPENRDGIIRLAKMCNERTQSVCRALTNGNQLTDLVGLTYCPAMADVQFGSAAFLSDIDAWHPSACGHEALAACVYRWVSEMYERSDESVEPRLTRMIAERANSNCDRGSSASGNGESIPPGAKAVRQGARKSKKTKRK